MNPVPELNQENVLIIGGAGFIGSTVVRQLLENSNNVIVLDSLVTGSIENIRDAVAGLPGDREVSDLIQLIEEDVRHADISGILENNSIDYVFHLAAEPYVPSCYDNPQEFFSVNASGTLRLLMACKKANVTRVLVYSSSEVYGTAREVPMDEEHPISPQSTYAVSKLSADRLCFTLFHEQDIPVVILRQFNCYGPRETHPYIVPELVAQFSKSNAIELGNVEASRDLTYVSDAAEGALKLINCPAAEGEVVNLGYGNDFTVKELARTVGELMGHEDIDIRVREDRKRVLDVQQLHCDYSKASDLIGYRPTVSLEEGLKRTIDWYRENGSWIWETEK